MTFSTEWEGLFRGDTHLSQWPWSDLVSYVYRYAHPEAGFRRVLEVGCGAGANIPLFLRLGMDYWAVEGSPTIVARLHTAFPELAESIVVGDFTCEIPFEGPFDLVVDRGSLTHNDTASIRQALRLIHERLRPGGKLLGIDWFSDAHGDSSAGVAVDAHTRRDIPEGHLKGTGQVHFSSREHLLGLLSEGGFVLERLEHKRNEVSIPSDGGCLAWWKFVAVKP